MWEVIVGAVAALAGGFGGAMLQARSSKQLLATQLKDAEITRRETYAREDQARFADLKRQAYGDLWSNWQRFDVAEEERRQAEELFGQLDEPDPDGPPWEAEEYGDAYRSVTQTSELVSELEEKVTNAMETVVLLAPVSVRNLMPRLEDGNGVEGRKAFLAAARADLGIEGQSEPQ